MEDVETGQVQAGAAQIYEGFFVPAPFDQWPEHVLDGVGVGAGDRVLEVGCGTGIRAGRRVAGSPNRVRPLDAGHG